MTDIFTRVGEGSPYEEQNLCEELILYKGICRSAIEQTKLFKEPKALKARRRIIEIDETITNKWEEYLVETNTYKKELLGDELREYISGIRECFTSVMNGNKQTILDLGK